MLKSPLCISLCVLLSSIGFLLIAHLIVLLRKPDNLDQIIKSFYRIETLHPKPRVNHGPLVLVGFGGCFDITVKAIDFLNYLKIKPYKNEKIPQVPEELMTMEDIRAEFANTFALGAAAERTVSNKNLFDDLIKSSNSAELSQRKVLSLGGNAAVMANRLAQEGLQVGLASRLSKKIREYLHPNVKVLQAPPAFGLTDPPSSDVHLVLEYEKGEKWGNLTSPRANRLIFIRDQENPLISGLWSNMMNSWFDLPFELSGRENKFPDLFVLGGLQTMNNWNSALLQDIRVERLEALNHFMINSLPKSTLVHFEMASFNEQALAANLTRLVLPFSDSIGLNEQELPSLVQLLRFGHVPIRPSDSTPRVASVLDQIRDAWALLTDPALPNFRLGQRTISRIHLHTLGFQVIMVRQDPKHLDHKTRIRLMEEHFGPDGKLNHIPLTDLGRGWPHSRGAAAKASLTAYRYTCAEASIDPEKTRIMMDDSFAVTADRSKWPKAGIFLDKRLDRVIFNSSNPVQCWFEDEPTLSTREASPLNDGPRRVKIVQICVAPGLVCRDVRKTAGAGDNISAAALSLQTTVQHVPQEV